MHRLPFHELIRHVRAHPEWLEFAWPGVARYHAGRREFEEAWELVSRHATPPVLQEHAQGGSIAQLEQELYASPGDYAAGYALYRAQIDAGKTDDALATLRHFTVRPEAPLYFQYLQAQTWAVRENWERAWRSWQAYESAREP